METAANMNQKKFPTANERVICIAPQINTTSVLHI